VQPWVVKTPYVHAVAEGAQATEPSPLSEPLSGREPKSEESVVIICQCASVSDRSVSDAVASGAQTLAQVCRATQAGRDCGACVFNVRRVIVEQDCSRAGYAPDVCSV
jgi:bacterioferritin-associated ferredoxin